MSKSEKTYELEEIITLACARPDRIGCPEVTLDDFGIVDFISMDLGGDRTVRCYELKISKSDFLSDAKKTFIGEYNYYVVPTELYHDIKGHVEPGIGVWIIDKHGTPSVKKRASRMTCQMDKGRIMGKILRALNRENLKHAENMWRKRQIEKRVSDTRGAALHVGDAVEYRGRTYTIIEMDYARDGLATKPIVTLVPVDGNDEVVEGVRPSIVKKVMLDTLGLGDI